MEISKQTKANHTKINFNKAQIKFVKAADNPNELAPQTQIHTYYQICQFKNKFTKKYECRKIIFNEQNEILKIFEREYDHQEISSFVKHHRENKFKMYPTNDISSVELPSTTDIICCQSELLNNNNNEYGYQQLDGNDLRIGL